MKLDEHHTRTAISGAVGFAMAGQNVTASFGLSLDFDRATDNPKSVKLT